jgi:hypothetical protein
LPLCREGLLLFGFPPIARIFFYRLSAPVEEAFKKGITKGIEQRLESSRTTEFGTLDECRRTPTAELLKAIRHIPLGGNQLCVLMNRQDRHVLLLAVAVICWPVLLVLASKLTWLQSKLGDITVNVIASFVFSGLLLLANWILRKRQVTNG